MKQSSYIIAFEMNVPIPIHPSAPPPPDDGEVAAVLTKATLRAAEHLGISRNQLAEVLGTSAASLSRASKGRYLDPRRKEGELAILFVRLFRSLDAWLGGNGSAMKKWMHAHNHHLEAAPSACILTVQGLVRVVEYLDAMRGKI